MTKTMPRGSWTRNRLTMQWRSVHSDSQVPHSGARRVVSGEPVREYTCYLLVCWWWWCMCVCTFTYGMLWVCIDVSMLGMCVCVCVCVCVCTCWCMHVRCVANLCVCVYVCVCRFLLASFYTINSFNHSVVNLLVLCIGVLPKLPYFHRFRLFGINKYWMLFKVAPIYMFFMCLSLESKIVHTHVYAYQ